MNRRFHRLSGDAAPRTDSIRREALGSRKAYGGALAAAVNQISMST